MSTFQNDVEVEGTLTAGAVVSDITGDITGDVVGDVIGNVTQVVTPTTDSGAIPLVSGVYTMSKAGAQAMTLAAPTDVVHDGVTITIVAISAQAHTVTATTVGFNAGDAGADVATFGGAIGDSMTVIAYGGEWYVVSNINVTLA